MDKAGPPWEGLQASEGRREVSWGWGQEGGQPDEQGRDPLAFLAGTQQCCPGHSLAVVSQPSSTDSMAVTRDLVPSVSLPKAGLQD